MADELHEFYAVTMTSVYRVSDERDAEGVPIVEKVAMRIASAVPVGGRLKKGKFVGLIRLGIILFNKTTMKQRLPEEGDIHDWKDNTTPVVGLFFYRREAMECFHALDLEPFDSRWASQTRGVLNVIGQNHQTFIVSPTFSEKFQGA